MIAIDIETLLNQTLKVSEIESLCESVSFILGESPGPYVSYRIYDSEPSYYEGSIVKSIKWYVQIDIFTDSDYYELSQAIRKQMILNGFEVIKPGVPSEDDNFICHFFSRWSITLEDNTEQILKGEN